MSQKEHSRLEILSLIKAKKLSVGKAARLLKLSVRQTRRLWRRYRCKGCEGLVHGLRGRPSNRAYAPELRGKVLEMYRQRYGDFGPTLASEHLREDGYAVGVQTLRRWLLAEGLWARRRRRSRHRSRRLRKAYVGEMVQMDGSHHDWLEGRGPWCVLMVLVDDATGRTYAQFYEGETTAACFEVFGRYVKKYGIPRSLYVDRDSIYRADRQATVAECLRGESPLTQFSRAMKQLGVELILANSPQAKGRVERMNGTLQDRLVKEMRLAKIGDLDAANAFLEKRFLPALNRKFAIRVPGQADVHGALLPGQKLEQILCFQEQRVVSRDWCVQWRNRILQLQHRHQALGLAGKSITVREKLNGTVQLVWGGHALAWREVARPLVEPAAKRAATNNRKWTPSATHPWKAGLSRRPHPRVSLASAAPARDLHADGGRVTFLLK